MAKESAANIKTQAAAIATALNTALGDTVLTGIHEDWLRPEHPMRQIHNLVKLSAAGVFSANDDYIDAAYADKEYTVSFAERVDKITNPPT